MLTYDEFKQHLTVFLWKDNDAVLRSSLDNLINMAHASLTRDLRHERRHASATLVVEALDVPLPEDYHTMRSIADTDTRHGEFEYVDPAYLIAQRDKTQLGSVLPIYSLKNKTLLLSGPMAPGSPLNLSVHYRASVPNFSVTNTSWLADEMLDLYTYAVLKHTAPFLREDERLTQWVNLYNTALLSANEDSAHEMARGQMVARLPSRQAGVRRRGDRTSNGKLHT